MTIRGKKYKKRYIFPTLIVVAVVALFILPFSAWLVGDESFAATSDADFCVGCHSMEPMVKAQMGNVHGGNNSHGVRASCTDCHLPHDNSYNYFVAKAQTGTHDLWVETFNDVSKINWQAKREHRESYVYDSGCLACHENLEAATADQGMHDNYFAGTIDAKCVTCHEEVGHVELNKYLLEVKYKYHFDE